jgi:hypothetical protein
VYHKLNQDEKMGLLDFITAVVLAEKKSMNYIDSWNKTESTC